MAASKRQTTMAKLNREQAVREKRLRKQERKDLRKREAAELKNAAENGAVAEHDAAVATDTESES